MSKKQDIMDNLVTSLLEITEQGGYSQTVKTCKLQLDDYEQYTKGKYPFIFPIELDKTFSRNGYGTGYYNTLPVRLVCGLHPDNNADNFSAFDNFVRDIKVKLEQNPFRVDYNGSTIRDGLVSWWDMRETSGVRYDAHSVNTLTPNGSVSAAQGVVEGSGSIGAIDFEGSTDDQFLSTATINSTNLDYNSTTTQISGSCFAKVEAFGAGGDFESRTLMALHNHFTGAGGDEERGWRWYFFEDGTSITFDMYTEVTGGGRQNDRNRFTFAPEFSISAGTWIFCAFDVDFVGRTVTQQIDTYTYSASILSDSEKIQTTVAPFFVGAWQHEQEAAGYQAFMDGLIDCVGLWNRNLTSAEKTYLYNSGNGRQYSDFGEQSSPSVSNTRIIRVEPYTNFQKAPIYFTVDLEVDYVHEKGEP